MKYHIVIIFFVSIVVLTQADVKHEKLRTIIGRFLKASFQHKTDCVEESKVSKEAVDKYWNLDYSGENDQNLKCYIRCAYIKSNIIDEKGVILLDDSMYQNGILHQLIRSYPDFFMKAIEYCKNPKSTDLCEAAYEMTQCGMKWITKLS